MSTSKLFPKINDSESAVLQEIMGTSTFDRIGRLEVALTLEQTIPGEISNVFDFVSAQDVLPKILTGYGLVPGVAFTSDVSGPWDQPGSTRTVHLLDGSTVREGISNYSRPVYFAYLVSRPNFSLKHLMSHAQGAFFLVESEAGTHLKWTYTFQAKNWLTKIPLRFFVKTQWRGYMEVCLKNIVKHFSN